MAAASSVSENKAGLIILGNAGSAKSFLCNLLIGDKRFESAFQPGAVTKETEHHRVKVSTTTHPHSSRYFYVFNIPGLVDVDDKRIEQNIQEIKRAFKKCPNSIVLYVW
jgi:ribosome biogenesis GTPase A